MGELAEKWTVKIWSHSLCVVPLLLVLAVAGGGGCAGGGTSGTGINPIAGFVMRESGERVAGMQINASTSSSEDVGISAEDGSYTLQLDLAEGALVRYQFLFEGIESEFNAAPLPAGVVSITFIWVLTDTGEVVPSEKEIFFEDGSSLAIIFDFIASGESA